jgi:hypothetical protein
MKVDIELADLEKLKKDLDQAESKNKELETRLASLNEYALKREAVRLADLMFQEYLKAVFQKLGFQIAHRGIDFNSDFLMERLGMPWWKDTAKWVVEIGATVTNEWREAFFRIGIVTKEAQIKSGLSELTPERVTGKPRPEITNPPQPTNVY